MEVEAVMRLYLRIAASATAKALHLGRGKVRELALAIRESQWIVEDSALSMLENAQTSSCCPGCKAMGMLPAHLAQSGELLQI